MKIVLGHQDSSGSLPPRNTLIKVFTFQQNNDLETEEWLQEKWEMLEILVSQLRFLKFK